MTFDAYTISLHCLVCKACGTLLEDTDPERLGREMDAHENGGCG